MAWHEVVLTAVVMICMFKNVLSAHVFSTGKGSEDMGLFVAIFWKSVQSESNL